jgi:hypothetical protein
MPFTSRMPTRGRLGEIVTGGHPHGDRPIAVAIANLAKTYPVPFLRLKKLLRRKFKSPVEAGKLRSEATTAYLLSAADHDGSVVSGNSFGELRDGF